MRCVITTTEEQDKALAHLTRVLNARGPVNPKDAGSKPAMTTAKQVFQREVQGCLERMVERMNNDDERELGEALRSADQSKRDQVRQILGIGGS